MSEKSKPTHTNPGGVQQEDRKRDDGVVNDSLGTVDPADSTGTDEEKKKEADNARPRNTTGRKG